MTADNQAQAESQNTPTAEATPDVTPQVAPEAPASETANTTTISEPLPTSSRGVSSVADYEKMLAEALKPAPEPTPVEAGENPPSEEPTTEPEPTQDTEQPEATEQEPQDEPQQTRKEFRPRLSSLDTRQQEAILLVKELKDQGKEISLAEAERRINAKYGVEVGSESQSSRQEPEAPTRTVEQIDAEIAAKEAEAEKAAEDLDVKTALRLQRDAFNLREEKARLDQEATARISREEAQFNRGVEASRQRAMDIYPVATDKDHAIHQKATEIWTAMQGTNNPLIHDADAPFKVYQMAANELGIAPLSQAKGKSSLKSSTQGTPRPQAVQQSAVRRSHPAAPVASAGDRTTQQGPAQISLGKIRNAYDYAKIARSLGANV